MFEVGTFVWRGDAREAWANRPVLSEVGEGVVVCAVDAYLQADALVHEALEASIVDVVRPPFVHRVEFEGVGKLHGSARQGQEIVSSALIRGQGLCMEAARYLQDDAGSPWSWCAQLQAGNLHRSECGMVWWYFKNGSYERKKLWTNNDSSVMATHHISMPSMSCST